MIRYYGLYAKAHRGKKRKAGVDPSCSPIIEDEVPFIEDHKVIEKIINHLKLTFKAERQPSPQAHLNMAAEERSEYV